MKFRSLADWQDPAGSHGWVFLAQLLEEMLFDFSLDTYKPSVLHTGLLVGEALSAIREIEAGTLRAPTLQHITAEICTNLEKDPVAKALISLPADSFYPVLKNPKSPIKEVEVVLQLLNLQLSNVKYRAKNEELLLRELAATQSHSEIRRLARSYITSLMADGFSQKHLEEEIIRFFYKSPTTVSAASAANGLPGLFPRENTKYTVVFAVDPLFYQFTKGVSEIQIDITPAPKGIDPKQLEGLSSPKGGKKFAVLEALEARDPISARAFAESRLQLAGTLINLFHHKEEPGVSAECTTLDTKTGIYKRLSKPINAMHKCGDLIQHVAHKRLKLLLNDFSMEQESFFKFLRSSELHSMALASNTTENQLLNLWISIESLIPSETRSEDMTTIEHIASSMLPFLNINYVERLLNNLVKDLLYWNPVHIRAMFRAVDGYKFTDKLARILVFPEHAGVKAGLVTKLDHFYLLKDRLEYFSGILASPTNVLAALEAHRERVEWQIRRIYRTRNIIVHSGRTPWFTRTLIEHTHDYLDTVLNLLIKLASKPKAIHSVAQGFKYIDVSYKTYIKGLSVKGLAFDKSNLVPLVFARP